MLTIIIPTYNRSQFLGRLLNKIQPSLVKYPDLISLIISNNASTDDTLDIILDFKNKNKNKIKNLKLINHELNIGADENFCSCIDIVSSKYFWIIGDDDLPKNCAIENIIKLLRNHTPDLLYLKSAWFSKIDNADDTSQLTKIEIQRITCEDFVHQVNVWITFISGMIVNLDSLIKLNSNHDIRKYAGTSLVQLGWVVPLLLQGKNFYITSSPFVLATSGNAGGYKLLTVFGENFPRIMNEECGINSPILKTIIKALIWGYLPGVVWLSRVNRGENFMREDPLVALRGLRKTVPYWTIYLPLLFLPKYIANLFWISYKIISKIRSLKNF